MKTDECTFEYGRIELCAEIITHMIHSSMIAQMVHSNILFYCKQRNAMKTWVCMKIYNFSEDGFKKLTLWNFLVDAEIFKKNKHYIFQFVKKYNYLSIQHISFFFQSRDE